MAALPPSARVILNLLADTVLAAGALPLACALAQQPPPSTRAIALAAFCLIAAGYPFGLFRQYWRFAGVADLLGVAGAAVLAAALTALLGTPNPVFPVLHAVVLFVLLGLPRAFYRLLRTPRRHRAASRADADGTPPVLVAGSAEDADLFLRALKQDRRRPVRVVGLLAPNPRQTGRRLQGYAFLGTIDDADAVLARLATQARAIRMVIVVSPDLDGAALSRLVDAAARYGATLRRAPRPTALHALAHPPHPDTPSLPPLHAASPIELRPVAIEDLLNRPQVPLDREAMARLVAGRRVIVTGAGGTIGAELARQVAALAPAELALIDNGEYALWQIDLELAETHGTLPRRALLADIRDAPRIEAIFAEFGPELVFHAAALKHVPMVEANPIEGLLTNVAGTRHVADAARAAGATAMVLISTDKAVNPTSVMGASKRLAEMYCQALDVAGRRASAAGAARGAMRCVTVRFGNVLGSTGSVVPLFQRQLQRGGPLTVTHPDMQRYFMTVREAVGLVLEASVLSVAGAALPLADEGGIFVLDMGPPVKIVDLARQMVRLAGLRPGVDVEIRFSGLRPGEKLYEELFHGAEPPVPTGHPGLLMASPRTADPAIVGRAIDELAAACRAGRARAALAQLGAMVPEFAHNATGDAPAATARA